MIKRYLPKPIKKQARRLLQTPAARALHFIYQHDLRGKTPVIVYQMGKVGSRSVVASLQARDVLVYHAHSLNAPLLRQRLTEVNPLYTGGLRHWIWLHDYVLQKRNVPVKFITLVRDPIAQNVASFFENLDRFTDTPHAYAHYSLEQLLDLFYAQNRDSNDYPLTWFDKTIKAVPGIDVFAHPFPQERGYQTLTVGKHALLLLKVEMDDDLMAQAIGEFLGLADFRLLSANIGDEKAYADLYRAFKARVVIREDILDTHYNATYTRHFYTPEEIETMRRRWLRVDRTSV